MTAFLAGGFSALALPPTDMFWILFFTFPVLVWLVDGTAGDPGNGIIARARPAFVTGWWFAFGYFLAGLWWIGAALLVDVDTYAWVVPLAVLGIPAFLALFWAFAISLARLLWSDDWRRIAILATSLGVAEFVRGTVFTGFPWNLIGYAAVPNALMMQSVSVLGSYGITPLAILVFASPAIFAPASGKKPRRVRALLSFCLLLVVLHTGFGYWRLNSNPTRFVDEVRLRIVQPAIRQKEKWLPENEAKIFKSYLDLSNSSKADITHFIWPESAFPFVLTQRRDALAAIAELLPPDAYLITGAMRVEAGLSDENKPRVFNSVYVINHKGEIAGAADKTHLVPFGEYLPFQQYAEGLGLRQLTGIEGGFSEGATRTVLSTKTAGRFLPLICYEIIFPNHIRPLNKNQNLQGSQSETRNINWIVNVTNDAWFGKTPGPYQHQRQAVIRGVEEGLPVVRAANSGISSVSDAYGRVVVTLGLGEIGKLDSGLPKPAQSTYYQKIGNWGFFIITALMALLPMWRRNY
ncbi:MAG: apolipoprotein N-acyltransferase [Hyphomicrobiales bacterium]|nr:apolipoprotein N-acyltransferase [Hyphomicrobiales bacterium]